MLRSVVLSFVPFSDHFEKSIQSGIFICVKSASQPTSQYLYLVGSSFESLFSKDLSKAAGKKKCFHTRISGWGTVQLKVVNDIDTKKKVRSPTRVFTIFPAWFTL
jgi:hypothetical protein